MKRASLPNLLLKAVATGLTGLTALALWNWADRLRRAEKRLLQQALTLQETQTTAHKLAEIIEQASETVVMTDLDGRIVYANPAFERISGYTRQEALGQNPSMLSSGQHDDAFYQQMWQTLLRDGIWIGSFVNRRKDGSLYYEAATIFPIKDPSGTIVNYSAVKRDITPQVVAEQALRQRESYLSLLNRITLAASAELDLDVMLQALADQMGALIEADGCCITLWDEQTERARPGAASGSLSEIYRIVIPQPDEATVTEHVLRKGGPLVIADVSISSNLHPRLAALYPARSLLGLPLIASEHKLGAVLLAFDQPHVFTPQEINICEQAASQIALALLKTYALEDARRQAREADLLRETGAAVTATLNVQDTIERILAQLGHLIPYDSASVLLRNGDTMEVMGGVGFHDPSALMGKRFLLDDTSPSTRVVQTRGPVVIEDAPLEYAIFKQWPYSHIRGWLGVPLIVKGEVIGLLGIDSIHPGAFNQHHVHLALAVADQVAIALENARLFEDTRRMAITDTLTGLYNRGHFFELARREFERSIRYARPLSAIMLDLDHFKHVNDTYGHMTGDQVLKSVVAACKAATRSSDLMGRFGGEEFVLLLPETNPEQAYLTAERLRKSVEDCVYDSAEGPLKVTISLGLYTCSPHLESKHTTATNGLEMMIDRADQALLRSKTTGRNRVTVWEPD